MRSVFGASLDSEINLQANISIGHTKEQHFLVKGLWFFKHIPPIHLQQTHVIARCSVLDGRHFVKQGIRFNLVQRLVKIQGRTSTFHLIVTIITGPFLFPNHMLHGIDNGVGVLPNCIPLILRDSSIGRNRR